MGVRDGRGDVREMVYFRRLVFGLDAPGMREGSVQFKSKKEIRIEPSEPSAGNVCAGYEIGGGGKNAVSTVAMGRGAC